MLKLLTPHWNSEDEKEHELYVYETMAVDDRISEEMEWLVAWEDGDFDIVGNYGMDSYDYIDCKIVHKNPPVWYEDTETRHLICECDNGTCKWIPAREFTKVIHDKAFPNSNR